MQVKDVMSAKPITVTTRNSIWHAVQIMLKRDVSGLPVVDDNGEIAGIITEGDLLERIEIGRETPADVKSREPDKEQRISAYLKSHAWCVADVMTTEVIAVEQGTPLSEVASLMRKHRIKRVPVLQGRKLVGIVSRRDLLRILTAPASWNVASGDAALQRSVVTRLGEINDLHVAGLEVIAKDGIVRVCGTVTSEAERDLVRAIAETVPGVDGVRNDIRIAAPNLEKSTGP